MWAARKRPTLAVATVLCLLASGPAHAETPGTAAAGAVSSSDGLVEPPPEAYRPTPPPIEHPTNTLAYVSLVSGGVFLATGIGLGVASVIEHRTARDFEQRANATEEELEGEAERQYDEAIARRDDFRVASGVAGGVGLGLFLFSGILFARDHIREDAAPKPAYVATPVIGPGLAGGVATVTF